MKLTAAVEGAAVMVMMMMVVLVNYACLESVIGDEASEGLRLGTDSGTDAGTNSGTSQSKAHSERGPSDYPPGGDI